MCFAMSGQCFRTEKHIIIKNYHLRLRGKHFPFIGFFLKKKKGQSASELTAMMGAPKSI